MLKEFGGGARRLVLFGLNVFFLIALFMPFFSVDMLITTVSVSVWDTMTGKHFAEFILDDMGWTIWLVRLAQLMLVGIPVVYGLKILGVFGPKMKDSKAWGVILSLGELIALLGLPLIIFLNGTSLEDLNVSEALEEMSTWFFIWIVLVVVSIVLTVWRDGPGKVLPEQRPSLQTKCPFCGKAVDRKTSRFCGYCGKDLSLVPVNGWICPSCGTLGKENDTYCSHCGAIRLK